MVSRRFISDIHNIQTPVSYTHLMPGSTPSASAAMATVAVGASISMILSPYPLSSRNFSAFSSEMCIRDRFRSTFLHAFFKKYYKVFLSLSVHFDQIYLHGCPADHCIHFVRLAAHLSTYQPLIHSYSMPAISLT